MDKYLDSRIYRRNSNFGHPNGQNLRSFHMRLSNCNKRPAKVAIFIVKQQKSQSIMTDLMALHPNFDTIAVRVQFGANGCVRVQFVLVSIICSSNSVHPCTSLPVAQPVFLADPG